MFTKRRQNATATFTAVTYDGFFTTKKNFLFERFNNCLIPPCENQNYFETIFSLCENRKEKKIV